MLRRGGDNAQAQVQQQEGTDMPEGVVWYAVVGVIWRK